MPKMKSHSGAKKRFRVTRNKKVLHKTSGTRHLLAGWSGKWGRSKRKKGQLTGVDARVIRTLLPYG